MQFACITVYVHYTCTFFGHFQFSLLPLPQPATPALSQWQASCAPTNLRPPAFTRWRPHLLFIERLRHWCRVIWLKFFTVAWSSLWEAKQDDIPLRWHADELIPRVSNTEQLGCLKPEWKGEISMKLRVPQSSVCFLINKLLRQGSVNHPKVPTRSRKSCAAADHRPIRLCKAIRFFNVPQLRLEWNETVSIQTVHNRLHEDQCSHLCRLWHRRY